MEIFKTIIEFIDVNLIYPLPALILTLIFTKLFFKSHFKAAEALNVVRWIIIIYAVLSIFHMLFGTIFRPGEYAFMTRATGPYEFAYWLMFACAMLLPFTLLIEKLGRNSFYVMLLAILLKIGRYFEIFVILVTNFHQDYMPGNIRQEFIYPSSEVLLLMLQGVILAVTILGIVQFMDKINSHNYK
jgi:hypothetical protein